jgi:hypothetical protein
MNAVGVSLQVRDFEFACGVLNDDRALIAAGKKRKDGKF